MYQNCFEGVEKICRRFGWIAKSFELIDFSFVEYNRSLSETVNSNSPNEEDLALNGHASMASMQSNGIISSINKLGYSALFFVMD